LDIKFKILCLENSLGIAINQTILNNTIPLTNYYFWPRSDVWEQIRLEINSKNWITEQDKINILNNVTKILNSWSKNTKMDVTQDNKILEFIGTT
jgi:30S ribosomal protein 3